LSERKYEITVREALQWAEKYPKVKIWLSKIQRKKQSAWNLWLFCETTGKNPDELFALKDDPKNREVEYLLDNFVAESKFTNAVTINVVNAVKSYFKWNYRELAKASGQITFEKQKPYRKHSKEELRKIHRAAQNPRDRALITFTWSTGIARETLDKIQWKHLESDWETQETPHISLPPELIKGHGRGKYAGVRQETFLTPEAKKDLMDYKDWLERVKGIQITPESYIWVGVDKPHAQLYYGSFSKIACDLAKRSGVLFSWHDARRYVETTLEEIHINPNWARKIRGRKVRGEEAPYSRPAIEQLREKFREATSLLEFTSEKPRITKEELRGELFEALPDELLKPIAEKHKMPIEEVRHMLRTQGKLPRLEVKKKPKPKEENDCPNGEHCQRLAAEQELEDLLTQGWRVQAVLPSGKIVIAR